jgi:hypothetical protein
MPRFTPGSVVVVVMQDATQNLATAHRTCGGQKVDQQPFLRSGGSPVVMVKSPKHRMTNNPWWRLRIGTQGVFRWIWNTLVNPLMRSRVVKVRDILTDDAVVMLFIQNKDMIQTFAPHTADEALTDGIGLWCCHRGLEHLNLTVLGYSGEAPPILLAIISDQKTGAANRTDG